MFHNNSINNLLTCRADTELVDSGWKTACRKPSTTYVPNTETEIQLFGRNNKYSISRHDKSWAFGVGVFGDYLEIG